MKSLFLPVLGCLLVACAHTQSEKQDLPVDDRLHAVLATQDDTAKARYTTRKPYETLTFFGVEPGMTVVEVLPGEGWYSKILVPYLGAEGQLIGVDYPSTIWPNFPFASEAFMAERKQWPARWSTDAKQWAGDDGAQASAYAFDQLPTALNGSVDMVLYFRALHGMARVEEKGGFLTDALARTYELLKPGGVVGIVQHQAREDKSDAWADGSQGYLKSSYVKRMMERAGFELVGESSVNENPKDQPGEEDGVWRLPPSLSASRDNPELQEAYKAIGESNRMTLLFRKPE
jgi:predicted methyltransferase